MGVPQHLRIVMGVRIDEAGRDQQSRGVEHFLSLTMDALTERDNLSILYRNVFQNAWRSRAIDNRTVLDDHIKHCASSLNRPYADSNRQRRIAKLTPNCGIAQPSKRIGKSRRIIIISRRIWYTDEFDA